ncbi:MAG: 30S ribosome-binding factor RbfA [Thomasclavelia sp.]|nr:30S ribosome-binding factor RbfA [Thomasclavelia sp.]
MSVKVDRMNTLILRDLSLILQNDVRNKDLKFCTITNVKTTNDLSISKVYVTFIGKDYDTRRGIEALEKSKGFLRTLLSKKLKIRKVPELQFIEDTSLEYGNHIEDLIKEIHAKEDNK